MSHALLLMHGMQKIKPVCVVLMVSLGMRLLPNAVAPKTNLILPTIRLVLPATLNGITQPILVLFVNLELSGTLQFKTVLKVAPTLWSMTPASAQVLLQFSMKPLNNASPVLKISPFGMERNARPAPQEPTSFPP